LSFFNFGYVITHPLTIFALTDVHSLHCRQWRAEVWWCPGRLLDWMPPTKF